MEGGISSFRLDPVESNQSIGAPSGVLSPEDIAWADSCLIKDELSENGWNSWNSLQAALFRIQGSEYKSSAVKWEDFSPLSREIGTSQILDARIDDVFMSDEAADNSSGDQLINENMDISGSRFNLKNVFLPTYNEKLRDWGTNDSDDLEFPSFVTEQSIGEIFKVWNLDVPAEEDEFIKQLNKAISESSLELTPPVSDDTELLKGLEDGSIDHIISGIADLTLNRISL
ncbi:hypothetical protein ACH5RR_002394 [Cinchona calisaya]|uniref:Uncharacterized protein n=1 Tax=Cinchona calisaya TaxID=153742 RepID=A0ABD3B6Z9_9GENT